MKLINYKRGYNNTFDCSIHGTIEMNREEFDRVLEYLFMEATKIKEVYRYFDSNMLTNDLARRIFIKNNRHIVQGFYVNIRVSATKAFVKEFRLRGYKRGNYQLKVDTSIETNFRYINHLANGVTI